MDMKLTNESMRTFGGHERVGVFNAGEKLTEFGEKQNNANEMLALNINDLIKRVCALEDKALKHEEIMKTLANELNGFRRELDRLRLSEKLNSGAIERLDKAMSLLKEAGKTEEK